MPAPQLPQPSHHQATTVARGDLSAKGDSGFGGAAVLGFLLLGVLIGAAAAWLTQRFVVRRHAPHGGDTPTIPPKPDTAPPHDGLTPERDRDVLVHACIDVADRLYDKNPPVFRLLQRGLADVGVASVFPDGEVVDFELHAVVERVTTSDPALDETVAATLFPGYTERDGRTIRRPQVRIYRWEAEHHGR